MGHPHTFRGFFLMPSQCNFLEIHFTLLDCSWPAWSAPHWRKAHGNIIVRVWCNKKVAPAIGCYPNRFSSLSGELTFLLLLGQIVGVSLSWKEKNTDFSIASPPQLIFQFCVFLRLIFGLGFFFNCSTRRKVVAIQPYFVTGYITVCRLTFSRK